MRLIPSRLFLLVLSAPALLASASLHGQPSSYAPRGLRPYLVNYSAIHGERFLAEFAARRFVLIDEAGGSDIPMMRAVNPDLPVLRFLFLDCCVEPNP